MTSKLTRERIELIANFHRAMTLPPSHDEIEELARMALAAMDSSESVELPLDYLQGHKDGLEWAAQLAEANHPETGDWLYDDPIELAKAIRKGPDMPPAQSVDSEPVAWTWQHREQWHITNDEERVRDLVWDGVKVEPLYRHAQPAPVVLADGKLRELFDAWFASDCSFDLSPEASEADNIAWRESYWYVWKRCRAAMLQAGNSPVIPEGYVMVPKDLLSELRDWAHPEIEKYCEMWEGRRDSEFPALRKVIADADALLAASPQEVKDGK